MSPPHWTWKEIGEMTRTQVAILAGGGKLRDPRRIEFPSVAAAHAWIDRNRDASKNA